MTTTTDNTSHGYLVDAEHTLARIGSLPESGRPEALLRIHRQVAEIKRQAQAMIGMIEAAVKDHILTTGVDIEIDENSRWYVAPKKTTKSIDDSAIAHAVLKAAEGDLGKFTTGPDGVLCSQPWKAATVRKLIGEDAFDQLFKTEVTTELVLKVFDKRYK